ncbi:MAG: kazal domain protein [Rickettsiales bacterium]|nr:kazal domain protein [Rickettsiales bacterium]
MRYLIFIVLLVVFSCKEEQECIIVEVTDPKPCTYHYQPVCGCNEVTYGNACAAESAGVMTYSEGECE